VFVVQTGCDSQRITALTQLFCFVAMTGGSQNTKFEANSSNFTSQWRKKIPVYPYSSNFNYYNLLDFNCF